MWTFCSAVCDGAFTGINSDEQGIVVTWSDKSCRSRKLIK